LPLPTIIKFAKQIANGLNAAQARGVVHRDIKPANILVTKESATIKITDFGLARIRDAAMLSREGMWVGTPAFMSPEQFRSERVDHRADLFALGSVLYTLCAGKVPFAAESIMVLMRQICEDKPAPLRQIRADVPSWLEQLIAKLHAKDPAERMQSAGDVVQEIERQMIQSR
jgi:serine/threonine protein kinase